MKKWITFDLDGTIMQNPFGKYVFPEIDALVADMKPGCMAVSELIKENKRRMQNNEYPEAYDWDGILNQFLLGQSIDTKINIEELVKKHSQIPKVHLLEDGIPDVLKELQTRGFSLAVITNGFYKYQYPVMETLGIVDFFEEIITPDKVLCGKPDINMIKPLIKSGTIIAHVGDRVDHDVVLANRAGAKSILINRKLLRSIESVPPYERTSKWSELKEINLTRYGEEVSPRGSSASDILPDAIISSIKEILLLAF